MVLGALWLPLPLHGEDFCALTVSVVRPDGLPAPKDDCRIDRSFRQGCACYNYAIRILSGNQPPSEYEQLPNGEKRPKDRLVISRQPKRKVDVKVVFTLICIAA